MPASTPTFAADLVRKLKLNGHQLVLAESCTAGLVASTLAGIPGASSVLVGSCVVYQIATKQQWLGIPDKHFSDFDVVSAETSQAMAIGILDKTPWATVAAGITGHLGPDAPKDLDGVAWATVARKRENGRLKQTTQKLILDQSSCPELDPPQLRLQRQAEACRQLIAMITEALTGS